MKTIITLSAGIIFSLNVFSQAPNWLWAKMAGGSGLENAGGVAVDGSGNSYITGRFFSTSITFGSTTLTGSGGAVYVVKYDASGNVVWAKTAAGAGTGTSIAFDGSGNVYVTGNYSSLTIIFGTDTLHNPTNGNADIFTVKYDSGGNILWAVRAGGNGVDYPGGIAVDGSGNCYVAGGFRNSTMIIGTDTLINFTSNNDVFIVKYNSSGNALWAKSAGGNSDDAANSIAIDGSGNIYITGGFGSTSITFGSYTLTGTGNDLFVVKYDGSGNAQWASGASGGAGGDIAVDGSGNSFVSGSFNFSITFGSTTLTSAGNTDMYVAKFNSSGSAVWATGAGGSSYEAANCIWVDGSGNFYINGYFQSTTITLGSTTLTLMGGSDVFVAKYSSAGNVLWAKGTGGTGNDLVYGLAVDGSGNSYSLGVYYSPSITFGSTTLTNAGSTDIFIAKLAGVVGINEIDGENILSLFPNPATKELRVQSPEFKVQSIKIFNVFGERVYDKQLSTFNFQLEPVDVSQLAPGIYFVKVCGEKEERVAKFVKQ